MMLFGAALQISSSAGAISFSRRKLTPDHLFGSSQTNAFIITLIIWLKETEKKTGKRDGEQSGSSSAMTREGAKLPDCYFISRLEVEMLNKIKSHQSSLQMLLDWPMQHLSDVIKSNEVVVRHNVMY